jgi:NAD(P)-dependent dehydrogenase (short-subunit alcohol dehydrogenase family)
MSLSFDFSGETAIVTGAAQGIGMSVARALAAAGARVYILDLRVGEVPALDRITAIACDVSDEAHVTAALAQIPEPVTLLVNNAGLARHAPPETYPLSDWRAVLEVNLTGTFLMSREIASRAIAAGRPASIVNLSSIAGTTSLGRGIFAYGAAKAGIDQLTRDLAVEWAGFGIRVNAVAPCQVETEGYANTRVTVSAGAGEDIRARALAGIPVGRVAQPEEVASAIMFLLAPESAMITGTVLAVDGGNLALNAGGSVRPTPAAQMS